MKAFCRCSNPIKKFDYKDQICKEPCQEGECKNGGNCTEHGDSKYCECLPGTTGDFCSEITKCKSENFCGIDEDAMCAYDTLRMEATCQCWYSSKQFDYEKKLCKEPCQENDCQNGGNCTGHGDFKFCECLPGTAGDHCSEITECKKKKYCGTDIYSTCTYDTLRMEAVCQCLYPRKQFDYEEGICR
ncbi:neurogenic locus notch homolog protein 2-like, partial [Stegodyphus dumicola]|uniref:neurogenic locus notch homolog protein 2-like n=1 Tax=Stegodyphus dumicola TaxID=202533 RepID=UPI0015AF4713